MSARLWQVEVVALALDRRSGAPVVLVRDLEGEHQIPIVIGQVEAMAIATALDGVRSERPMTHDLLHSVFVTLDVTLLRVEICDLREGTFYARLMVEQEAGLVAIDARPSDALALALRAEVPVYVHDHVLWAARMDPTPLVSDDEEEEDASERPPAQLSQRPAPRTEAEWEELLASLGSDDPGKFRQ